MKQYVCQFDKSHKLGSQQKLISHMKSCRSMQKGNYQCCQYNPLHWVRFNQIDQHEENCQNKFRPYKIKAEQKKQVEKNQNQFILKDLDIQPIQRKKRKKKQEIKNGLHQHKIQLWQEPNFQKFYEELQAKNKIPQNEQPYKNYQSDSDREEDQSQLSILQQLRHI